MKPKPAKIIIGQIDLSITEPFGALFPSPQYSVHAASKGDKILDLMTAKPLPDLLLMDLGMKDPEATQICRTIKANPDLRMIPILLIARDNDPDAQTMAIEAGCDDILIPPILPNILMARVQSLLRIKLLTDELDNAESVLHTLARTIEAKDRYTLGHADRVAGYAVELGKRLGMSSTDVILLRQGGMLHDVGKIAIPDGILTKPGKFTPEEFEIMKQHPVLGCDICEKLNSVREALPLIRHHHEKLDGSGYPDGLKGDAIPHAVRIISIVDIYDALRSKRSYKEAFSIDKTFEIMWEEVGKGWWDKNILSVWEKVVRDRGLDHRPIV